MAQKHPENGGIEFSIHLLRAPHAPPDEARIVHQSRINGQNKSKKEKNSEAER